MKFVSPHWLWLLLLLPLIFSWVIYDERLRETRFKSFIGQSLWGKLAPGYDRGARMRKTVIWLLAMGFGIIAIARPQWGTSEEVSHVTGKDVMIALDVSNSMEAEDVVPSRLKRAKKTIRTLAERLRGDRIGLVAFAGSAVMATPLTTDTDYLVEVTQYQEPKMIQDQGTDIGIALETALRGLDRGAEEAGGDSGGNRRGSSVVVLISDGEDHEGGAIDIAKKMKAAGVPLYVLGVGTSKGGPIPLHDDSGNLLGYKRDRAGQPIVTSFHPDAMMELASAAGGQYWNMSDTGAELDQLLSDLGGLSRGDLAERRYLVYHERFQIPLLISILLMLLELGLPAHRMVAALGVLTFLFSVTPARAAPIDTYMENKKGVDAYQKGDVDNAKKHFGAAQARSPELPELRFNQGVVNLEQGNAEEAAADFEEAAKSATAQERPGLAGQALFNRGTALSKKGDVDGAVQSYVDAIRSAKAAGDSTLEHDARKNLELLVQEQQKQKQQQQQQNQQNQQQQQNQQNQSQQNQNQQQQQKQQDQKKDQQQNNSQDQQKQQQQKNDQQQYDTRSSRNQKFESQKLSAEDADRVMAELKNRERELQVRMKKQNARPTNNTKDW